MNTCKAMFDSLAGTLTESSLTNITELPLQTWIASASHVMPLILHTNYNVYLYAENAYKVALLYYFFCYLQIKFIYFVFKLYIDYLLIQDFC